MSDPLQNQTTKLESLKYNDKPFATSITCLCCPFTTSFDIENDGNLDVGVADGRPQPARADKPTITAKVGNTFHSDSMLVLLVEIPALLCTLLLLPERLVPLGARRIEP